MTTTGHDTLGTHSTLDVGGKTYAYYSLDKAAAKLGDVSRLPFSMKVLFPGYSDRLAYQLGLIASDQPFEATKQAARINEAAFAYRDDPNFSRMIRR